MMNKRRLLPIFVYFLGAFGLTFAFNKLPELKVGTIDCVAHYLPKAGGTVALGIVVTLLILIQVVWKRITSNQPHPLA